MYGLEDEGPVQALGLEEAEIDENDAWCAAARAALKVAAFRLGTASATMGVCCALMNWLPAVTPKALLSRGVLPPLPPLVARAQQLRRFCRAVISAYFEEKGLVRQQLDSFNDFINTSLQEIVDENKLITVTPQQQHMPGMQVDDETEKKIEVGRMLKGAALSSRAITGAQCS